MKIMCPRLGKILPGMRWHRESHSVEASRRAHRWHSVVAAPVDSPAVPGDVPSFVEIGEAVAAIDDTTRL